MPTKHINPVPMNPKVSGSPPKRKKPQHPSVSARSTFFQALAPLLVLLAVAMVLVTAIAVNHLRESSRGRAPGSLALEPRCECNCVNEGGGIKGT